MTKKRARAIVALLAGCLIGTAPQGQPELGRGLAVLAQASHPSGTTTEGSDTGPAASIGMPTTVDPERLAEIAQSLTDRAARGAHSDGEQLFDELLDLDLRKSPVLSCKPPIDVARALGSLGELEAARDMIAKNLKGSSAILNSDDSSWEQAFELEVARALARLEVALGVSEATSRLEEIETRWRLSGADGPLAHTLRQQRPLYCERQKAVHGVEPELRYRLYPRDAFWSAGSGMHEHFDNIIKIHPSAAFETAERLRATFPVNLSLLARVRRLGGLGPTGPTPDSDFRLPFLLRQQLELNDYPSLRDLELSRIKLTGSIQAVTRALDRVASTDSRHEALRTELERLQWQRTELLNIIWHSDRETYIPTIAADIQKVLDTGTVMLYYMTSVDHTDLLVLPDKGEVSHHRIEMGVQQLEGALEGMFASLTHPSKRGAERQFYPTPGAGPTSSADIPRQLFEALIAPAESQIATAKRLVVIPDGPIHRLPLGALQRRSNDGELSYLAEWKPIHIAPSAAIYAALLARRASRHTTLFAAFGNPAYDRSAVAAARPVPFVVRLARLRGYSGSLAALPGSEREVETIGQMFIKEGREAQVFLGPNATEDAAKLIKQADYVHFAVHSIEDAELPEHSFLALSLPIALAEGGQNGILESWEIEDEMRLDSDLVTLSGCDTARGKERSGEGPSSLSRAFLGAGAHSVLATLWQVDDAATADLMPRIYRHLLRGSPKDEALRAAQIELLKHPTSEYRLPFYWAGIQLSGDWK